MDSLSARSVQNTIEMSVSTSESLVCAMIHYMPSIESLDPRLKELYRGARTLNSPRYGLGYIEQCDVTIPECRFTNPLPKTITKPAVEEILKYLTVISGCKKGTFPEEWIKKMTNWDLFTNPESSHFEKLTSEKEKEKLSILWKNYMIQEDCWISFFEWRKLYISPIVQVKGESSSTPGHKWKGIDGSLIESKTTFPPFQSIILEDSEKQAKAIPLLTDEVNQLSGIDKRVQSVSEQLNWTNIALRGMATQVFSTTDQESQRHIMDLQVSTNTVVHSVNQIHEKVVNIQDKMDISLQEVSSKTRENHEDLMDGLGTALTAIGKSLTDIKQKSIKVDKPIPSSFLLPSSHISILSPVYKPSEKTIKQKFPFFFPPEQEKPEASKKIDEETISLVSIRRPAYENISAHSTRPAAPDLVGKGNLPESQTFAEDWYQEWNINNLSVAQIRHMIDRMFVFYKIMCMKGKGEVEACKTIIQCFTRTLSKWWEVISSPLMISKMEAKMLKDEQGDIVYHSDGNPMNNMIGALTTLILEHWCGTEAEISDKHEIVLMNMKCRRMSEYEQFHKEWTQRIFEVKDNKNLLWKQVYMAALPSKFVEYLKIEETFPLPYETYTWGEIYSIITRSLIGLCTSMKIQKSVSKISYLPDQKSVCEQYGLYNTNPGLQTKKRRK
jgi:hypothetical protein